MSRVIHCCFDLDYILRRGGADEMANGGIRKDGRLLTAPEIMTMAVLLKAQGFEVLPTCANHDELGHCKGCEK
jgi:hypothetical protein